MHKKLMYFFSILLLSVSCETDFSVGGDHDETPVVHFLIDPSEEYHFMKINRTFLGDGNANVFATVKDSNHFTKVEAVVKQVDKSNPNTVINEWTLKDTIIEDKEPGAFYHPEEKLYYFKESNLDNSGNYLYKLEAIIEDGKHEVYGETELVEGVVLNTPGQNTSFRFANPLGSDERFLNPAITYSPGNASLFNTALEIKYSETTSSGSEENRLRWNLGEAVSGEFTGPNISVIARGELFYQYISDNIPVSSDVIERNFLGFDIVITAGTEDLNTYISVSEPTTSIAQNQPEFTNIEGGRGIFSSRLTVTISKDESNANIGRALSTNSTRELCNGIFTGNLDFCSPLVQDNDSDFSCD